MILADAPELSGAPELPGAGDLSWYPFWVGIGLVVLYVLLRMAKRDLLPRGPAPEVPWKPPDAFAVVVGWFFLTVFVVSLAEGLGVSKAWAACAGRIGSLPVVVAVLYVLIRFDRPHGPRRDGAFAGVLMCLALFPVVVGVFLGWTEVLDRLGHSFKEQSILEVLRGNWAAFFLSAVVLAPVAEEVVFRGVLYPALKRWGGKWPAMLLSAAIFSAVHLHLPVAAPLFFLGIALAWTYERTGTLLAPIFFHAAFNGWTFVEQLARSG